MYEQQRSSSTDGHTQSEHELMATAPSQPHSDGMGTTTASIVPPPSSDPTTTTTYGNNGPQPDIDGSGADPRANLANDVLREGGNTSLIRLLRTLQILWNLMEIIVICVILPQYWSQPCDRKAFRIFIIARACENLFVGLLHAINFSTKHKGWSRTGRTILTLFDYCMVLYALIELGETKTCKTTSPAIFGLTIALVCATMLLVCMPLLVLILICCCLPCIIAVLARLIESIDAPTGATQKQLEELPQYEWTPTLFAEHSVKGNTAECAVCLTEYDEGQNVIIYACQHAFHTECAKQWNVLNRTCPVCRLDPFGDDGHLKQPNQIADGVNTQSQRPQNDIESQ